MAKQIIHSTCRECYLGCGSLIHVEDGAVTRIAGNPDHPHSRGAFCIKGMNAPLEALQHPDRPLHPLRRVGERGEGKFERVSWNEALDGIAGRLEALIEKHGARSIAGAVSGHFYDRGVAMSLLLRSIGSPNYMINQDLCQGGRATATMLTGVPMLPGIELKNARCILTVGKSPSDSNIIEWMNIKAAKRAGAVLIAVDPRSTQTTQAADIWLPIRPGTDAALALSIIHVLLAENLVDNDFIQKWCVGIEELRARAVEYAPVHAAALTGVDADSIVSAARLIGTTKPFSMLLGHGIDAQENGVYTAIAFNALLALTGNIDRQGTNQIPKSFAGFRDYNSFVNDPSLRMHEDDEREIVGGADYPFWSGRHSVHQACHNPSVIEAILTGMPYPVRAIYASGVNIVCTYPDMLRTIEAIKSLDLFVVATDHMTPTAQYADYILPKTTLLEEEAVFIEDNCLSVIQRAVEPRGETKTDIEIAIALRDALRSRELIKYEALPWNSHRDFVDSQLVGSIKSFEDLCATGFHEFLVEFDAYEKRGFRTPSGKIELYSSQLKAAGYEPTPDYQPPIYSRDDDEFNLTLLTGIRTMALHHSRFRNHIWARKINKTPELKVNHATAEALGIRDGDWIWVEIKGGRKPVCLVARLTSDVPPDIVTTGMGWWFPELAGPDFGALTFNIEAGIPYGPHWDPISGSAEARNCACRIYRVDDTNRSNVPSVNITN